MNRFIFVLVVIVAAVSLVFMGCVRAPEEPPVTPPPVAPEEPPVTPPVTPEEPKTIRVGLNLSLSGPAAGWGVPIANAAKLVAEMTNNEGGVQIGGESYFYEIFEEDSQMSPELAVTATRKLIDRYDIDVMLGALFTHQSLGTICITEAAKVPSFACNWGPDLVCDNQCSDYSFKCCSGPKEFMPGMYEYLFEKYPGMSRIAELTGAEESTRRGAEMGRQYLESVGKEKVALEFHEPEVTDFYPFLTRVLAEDPELIVSGSTPGQFALIMKQAREMGYDGEFMYYITITPDMLDIAGAENAEGCISQEVCVSGPGASPGMLEFVDMYAAKHGEWNPNASLGCCVIPILTKAYEMAGTKDPDALVRVLENGVFHPFGMEARIADANYYDLPHQIAFPISILEVQGGQNVVVGTVSAAGQLEPWPEGPVYPCPPPPSQ